MPRKIQTSSAGFSLFDNALPKDAGGENSKIYRKSDVVPSEFVSIAEAKRRLKAKGWSYRSAAPALGVCYQHLALVLTRRRVSRRLLAAIAALPECADASRTRRA